MKINKKKTIAKKIFISYSFLLIFVIISLLIFTNTIIEKNYINTLKNSIYNDTILVEKLLFNDSYSNIQTEISRLSDLIGLRITIISKSGIVIADSSIIKLKNLDNHYYRPELQLSRKEGNGTAIRYTESTNQKMLYVSKLSTDKEFYIRIAKSLKEIDEAMSTISKIILISGFIAFIVSILINIFISRKLSSPIEEAVMFSESFAAGDFSKRILNYHNNEIGVLQKSLNKLADNLEKYIHNITLEQKKLDVTIESIRDALVVVNAEGNIIISNKSFRKLFNLDSNPRKKPYFEVIRGTKLNAKIKRSIRKETDEKFEHKLQSGEICEIRINTINEENSLKGILIVFHDITEKKEIDKIKTNLVGNLSHELKTPIAIIKGYLETILLQYDNKESSIEFIKKSLLNVDRQNSIINDMLKLNKIETSLDFPFEPIDFNDVIETTIASLNYKLNEKNISINFTSSVDNIKIEGSRFLSEQIIFNLIDNAINYNNKNGTIAISFFKQNNSLHIEISDTGIGIPDESINHIFERFYRVDKSRSRSTGGTGLGLSIVKHSIDLQNWDISVSSLGDGIDGTKFVITIPIYSN